MDPTALFQYTAFTLFVVTAAITFFRGNVGLAIIPTIAGLAYFGMIRDPVNMTKYRYADWAITTPLMLLALLSANRLPQLWVAGAVLADLCMIYFGFKASQERTEEKKRFNFWLSCAAFVPILYFLSKSKYTKKANYLTLLVWLLYPIVWYANDTNALSDTAATRVYAVMDVCAKVGLVFLLQA